MPRSKFATIGGAAFAIAFAGAVISVPANATVAPNGSFDFSWLAGNSVDTGDIARTTTSLSLSTAFPGIGTITSLLDPYLGNPNNFCGMAGGGCTAAHPPGFLDAGLAL